MGIPLELILFFSPTFNHTRSMHRSGTPLHRCEYSAYALPPEAMALGLRNRAHRSWIDQLLLLAHLHPFADLLDQA